MSAEHAPERYDSQPQGTEQAQTPQLLGDGILIHMYKGAQERRQANTEYVMFQRFVEHCQETFGVDPRTDDPSHSKSIAFGARQFLAAAVERRAKTVRELSETSGESVPQVFMIPAAPVERNLRQYYTTFGHDRRSKPDVLREKEEQWLKEKQRPIHAKTRVGGGEDEHGNLTPWVIEKRESQFPEIYLGKQLKALFERQGHQVAADSIDALLGAYGSWFPERILTAAARRSILRIDDSYNAHNIRRIPEDEIPEGFEAEHYRPR